MAAFPMRAGGAPDLDQPGARELLGRTLGRIHAIGALRPFVDRPALGGERLGAGRATWLCPRGCRLICGNATRASARSWSRRSRPRTRSVAADPAARGLSPGQYTVAGAGPGIRRPGRLRERAGDPGPVDVPRRHARRAGRQWRNYWRATSALRRSITEQTVRRALHARMLNHAAWVAERWADPAFPKLFPGSAKLASGSRTSTICTSRLAC